MSAESASASGDQPVSALLMRDVCKHEGNAAGLYVSLCVGEGDRGVINYPVQGQLSTRLTQTMVRTSQMIKPSQ